MAIDKKFHNASYTVKFYECFWVFVIDDYGNRRVISLGNQHVFHTDRLCQPSIPFVFGRVTGISV